MEPLIPIVPRSGVYLTAFGHGDDKCFAGLFRNTWKRIPLWARRLMLKHWRDYSDYKPLVCRSDMSKYTPSQLSGSVSLRSLPYISPRIELVHGWKEKDICNYGSIVGIYPGDRRKHCGPLAVVAGFGYLLRFHSDRFDEMPENVVQDVIDHELVHIIQTTYPPGYFGDTHGAIEQHADEQITSWGFDPESDDEWSADMRYTKRIIFENEVDAVMAIFTHHRHFDTTPLSPPARKRRAKWTRREPLPARVSHRRRTAGVRHRGRRSRDGYAGPHTHPLAEGRLSRGRGRCYGREVGKDRPGGRAVAVSVLQGFLAFVLAFWQRPSWR